MLLLSGLTMVVGLLIFSFGVVLYISKSELIAGIQMIGLVLSIGFVVFLIASLGFCSAYKRSTVWLGLYSCLVIILIMAEISLAVILFTDVFDVDAFLEDMWAELDNDSKVTIQASFKCCG